MEKNKGEVVLFPKLKEKLRHEGLEAVRHHKYEEAIQSLETLLRHEEADDEVTTGLLIAWVGVGEYRKAEEVCLDRMKYSEGTYFQYLHIYITILFHDGKYKELMSLVEEVLDREDVPHDVRTQLWQMYKVSKDIEDNHKQEEERSLVQELQEAFEHGNLHNQWNLIQKLTPHTLDEKQGFLEAQLMNKELHPVIKTAILEWFRKQGVQRPLEVHKFGKTLMFKPGGNNGGHDHYILKHIEYRLSSIEQNHPSMYELIVVMLYRYIYVRYPFLPTEEEVPLITQALKAMGYEYLQLQQAPNKIEAEIGSYMQDIEVANQQYRAITGE
ncbi:hypothetical protein U0355_05720 [Salimicrobium sp. PL1-032A]|uniref:hypothetical protein n=1 Tax=Salimicrobium sp. PL1-032A TaxID=3095364 RepID=UPI0032602CDA